MKIFDIITIGNAMLDVFLGIQENNAYTRLDRTEHTLSFTFGEKIHVDHAEFLPGGNACNVAVGLGRLGWETALCAEIGDDEFSHKIIDKIIKEPIETSLMKITQDAPSSFTVGINYQGERTLFVNHIVRKHEFEFSDIQTKWIYLTSLGEEWKTLYQKIIAYVKDQKTNLAFSPGTHQFEEKGLKTIHEILPLSYILFANKEEALQISKSLIEPVSQDSNVVDVKKLLVTLQKFGSPIVVVTDGRYGSYSIDEKGVIRFIEVFPAHILEKTGAGDAYATGFLSAIMSGLPASEAMRFGAVNASGVIEKVGSQPGLLTRDEILKRLAAHNNFEAKEI